MPDVNENEVEAVLARLKIEFVENARDQLDDVELRIDWLDSGRDISADDLYDVQRNIHNIKGQGGTFGYPLIGRIAHLFEDYLENAGGVLVQNISDMRAFIEAMRAVLIGEENYSTAQAESLLRSLPSGVPEEFSAQETHNVDVLLVMNAGLQRRMVAQELLSCGFRVNRASDCMGGISHALDMVPDIVFANYDMEPFTGMELSRVFGSIERLKDIHFVLFTSYDREDPHLADLPENVSVVEKRQNFAEGLSELLMEWGVFGKMAS